MPQSLIAMNIQAPVSFHGSLIPLSRYCYCGRIPFQSSPTCMPFIFRSRNNFFTPTQLPRSEKVICRLGEAETEPDGDKIDRETGLREEKDQLKSLDALLENASEKEKEQFTEEGITESNKHEIHNSVESIAQVGAEEETGLREEKDQLKSLDALLQNGSEKEKEQFTEEGITESNKHEIQNSVETIAQVGAEEADIDIQVASGSPLPGVKRQQFDESTRIPKETIDILRDQVFGFDTFFVTSQEPYEGGVLFKGNLRGNATKSYEKITQRILDRFGDVYRLFILINPEDDKPVAVVVPKQTLQQGTPAVPEWFAAAAFGLVTVSTLLFRNVPALQSNILSVFDNPELLKEGLPGTLVTALVLGVHEIGHIIAAKSSGIILGVPYFVPSSQIGSFGAITRIVNIVRNREELLKFAAAGPVAGFSFGLILLLLGFVLPPSDGLGVVVDASVFHESFLAGGIAKLLLGDALKDGTPISLNPLVLWSWAGLLINAINSIPAGELDGGRISFALWGRKASYRLSAATIALLGISSLFSDVAFYWVVLIFILQRGPIAPLSEEISDPEDKYKILGVAVLVLGLLVCLPYPFPFTGDALSSL